MQKITVLSCSLMLTMMLMSFQPLSIDYTATQSEIAATPPAAKASWVKDSHDFGAITRGVPVSIEFSFTNTGDAALIIKDVITSCGCTASDYAREPILPGKSSTIKVSYNAANAGAFTKTITVNSNDQVAAKILSIKGTVKQ